MSRKSSGELYCTEPVAGSMRVGWYWKPSPVEQTASVYDSYEYRPAQGLYSSYRHLYEADASKLILYEYSCVVATS